MLHGRDSAWTRSASFPVDLVPNFDRKDAHADSIPSRRAWLRHPADAAGRASCAVHSPQHHHGFGRRRLLSPTTGLDPAVGFTTLFGATLPYVVSFNGPNAPGGVSTNHPGINKLTIDAEALALKADGSGYFGDEYGANIYYFNSSKQIVGVVG